MKDRVPANPGRVLITPENGSAPFYATMTRADNPTQEGDPLNKNTLLKDATAALFGLTADAVPDDVLSVIKGVLNNNTNDISALKASGAKIETGSYTGTGTYGSGNKNVLTFGFRPQLIFIASGLSGYKRIGFCVRDQSGLLVLSTNLEYEGPAKGWYSSIIWGDETVSYYNDSKEELQLNVSGSIYNYVAIG